jgi:hypothetical protein
MTTAGPTLIVGNGLTVIAAELVALVHAGLYVLVTV